MIGTILSAGTIADLSHTHSYADTALSTSVNDDGHDVTLNDKNASFICLSCLFNSTNIAISVVCEASVMLQRKNIVDFIIKDLLHTASLYIYCLRAPPSVLS